jgi:hypothetical protein
VLLPGAGRKKERTEGRKIKLEEREKEEKETWGNFPTLKFFGKKINDNLRSCSKEKRVYL